MFDMSTAWVSCPQRLSVLIIHEQYDTTSGYEHVLVVPLFVRKQVSCVCILLIELWLLSRYVDEV